MKGKFTAKQITTLRSEYAKIKSVDPGKPTYKKLTAMLDSMSQTQLKQLAHAKINFVSGLAHNRIKEYWDKKRGKKHLSHDWYVAQLFKSQKVGDTGLRKSLNYDLQRMSKFHRDAIMQDFRETYTKWYDSQATARKLTTKNPRKQTVRKKKRSAAQLRNDRRLGRMAKARAKAKRGGRRKATKRRNPCTTNPRRKIRAPGTKRKISAKSNLWMIFKVSRAGVLYLSTPMPNRARWRPSRTDAVLMQNKTGAKAIATAAVKAMPAPAKCVGVTQYSTPESVIRARCQGK